MKLLRRAVVIVLLAALVGLAGTTLPPATHAASGGESRVDKGAYPTYRKGSGALGYGVPDKVISEVTTWDHPAKAVVEQEGTLVRVEFYLGGRYPVFFLKTPEGVNHLRYEQLHQTSAMDTWGRALLKANGGWAFEVVENGSDRFRYNASRVSRPLAGFDLFNDVDEGFLGL